MLIATRGSKFDISKESSTAKFARKFSKVLKVGAKLTKLSKEQADYISVGTEGPFKPDAYRY